MNRNEFINDAKSKYQLKNNDKILISTMIKILDYFNELEKEIETPGIENKFSIGGQYPDYPLIVITLGDNILNFERINHIKVDFKSTKDNQYTKQYENLNIDTLIIRNDIVVSEKHQIEISDTLFEKYLPYLLA